MPFVEVFFEKYSAEILKIARNDFTRQMMREDVGYEQRWGDQNCENVTIMLTGGWMHV